MHLNLSFTLEQMLYCCQLQQMKTWGTRTERNDKDMWKEALDSALTSLNNQSPHLDVYKKESISGEGALWLALISTSSPNKTLLSLSLSQYDSDDSGRDEGHPHWLNAFLYWRQRLSVTDGIIRPTRVLCRWHQLEAGLSGQNNLDVRCYAKGYHKGALTVCCSEQVQNCHLTTRSVQA